MTDERHFAYCTDYHRDGACPVKAAFPEMSTTEYPISRVVRWYDDLADKITDDVVLTEEDARWIWEQAILRVKAEDAPEEAIEEAERVAEELGWIDE